jgi:S1-C subfamily serine protease
VSTILTIKHLTGSLAGRSQRIVLQEGQRLRLGRSPDTDVRFSDTLDDAVSGTHAEISLQQGRLYVEDKRSSNGTFVNGAPCPPFQKIAVADGARIRLAKEGPEMQVLLEAAPAATAAGSKPATVPATAAGGAPSTAAGGASPTAVSGAAQLPAKESVGRATLLREIDRARQEERDVVSNQLASTQRSTGKWVALGLILVLLLAVLGIGGAMWWNRRQLAAQSRQLAAQSRQVQAEVGKVSAAVKATENVWADVEKRVSPAVVHIRCAYHIRFPVPMSRDGKITSDLLVFPERLQASGVLIRPGLVLTARHVAEPWKARFPKWDDLVSQYNVKPEYDLLEVQFPGNQQPLKASFVASDPSDLALLQFQPTSAHSVSIVTSNNDVKVTDVISVISYPSDLGQKQVDQKYGDTWTTVSLMTPTFVTGTVTQPLNNGDNFLMFDASVTHGCSGGAVLNEKGQLIGIVSARYESKERRPVQGAVQGVMVGVTVDISAPVPSGNFAVSPGTIHRFLSTHGIPD